MRSRIIFFILLTGLILSLTFNIYSFFDKDNKNDIINEGITQRIITEGNITYKVFLDNYYDVEYESTMDGLELRINNPCIVVRKSIGLSMKPYWEDNTLSIFDDCFPREDLQIGDIITYFGELDSTVNPHHRIIDIDYEKEWVRTQGDNPETNPRPDDFVGFDRIIGKEIAVLNVLEDKKIVKEEILSEIGFFRLTTFDLACVCSSSGLLKLCHANKTILEEDTFIQQNDLKGEYCNDD